MRIGRHSFLTEDFPLPVIPIILEGPLATSGITCRLKDTYAINEAGYDSLATMTVLSAH